MSVDIDSFGQVVVGGCFMGTTDFDPGPGVVEYTSNGEGDIFVSQLDSAGNLLWVDVLGGAGHDFCFGVAYDPFGAVYAAGRFTGTVDFDPGSGVETHISAGDTDMFAARFESAGSLAWARTWGGTSADEALGVNTDSTGIVAVAGQFIGTVDFNPDAFGEDIRVSNGSFDAFINVFDSAGVQQYSRTWGGAYQDLAYAIRCIKDQLLGMTYIATTGWFSDTVNFDTSEGTDNRVSNGFYDIFLTTHDVYGKWIYANTWGGPNYNGGCAVSSFDSTESLYVVGYYSDTVDFDPGVDVDDHTSAGGYDSFLTKLNFLGGW